MEKNALVPRELTKIFFEDFLNSSQGREIQRREENRLTNQEGSDLVFRSLAIEPKDIIRGVEYSILRTIENSESSNMIGANEEEFKKLIPGYFVNAIRNAYKKAYGKVFKKEESGGGIKFALETYNPGFKKEGENEKKHFEPSHEGIEETSFLFECFVKKVLDAGILAKAKTLERLFLLRFGEAYCTDDEIIGILGCTQDTFKTYNSRLNIKLKAWLEQENIEEWKFSPAYRQAS